MLAMNLLLTGNLTSLDPFALETWGNAGMIGINQDPMGIPAILLENETSISLSKVQSVCM